MVIFRPMNELCWIFTTIINLVVLPYMCTLMLLFLKLGYRNYYSWTYTMSYRRCPGFKRLYLYKLLERIVLENHVCWTPLACLIVHVYLHVLLTSFWVETGNPQRKIFPWVQRVWGVVIYGFLRYKLYPRCSILSGDLWDNKRRESRGLQTIYLFGAFKCFDLSVRNP